MVGDFHQIAFDTLIPDHFLPRHGLVPARFAFMDQELQRAIFRLARLDNNAGTSNRIAASTSQMARFETHWLVSEDNLAALSDLSGAWIERVHEH